jgi:hypothetical protein
LSLLVNDFREEVLHVSSKALNLGFNLLKFFENHFIVAGQKELHEGKEGSENGKDRVDFGQGVKSGDNSVGSGLDGIVDLDGFSQVSDRLESLLGVGLSRGNVFSVSDGFQIVGIFGSV